MGLFSFETGWQMIEKKQVKKHLVLYCHEILTFFYTLSSKFIQYNASVKKCENHLLILNTKYLKNTF